MTEHTEGEACEHKYHAPDDLVKNEDIVYEVGFAYTAWDMRTNAPQNISVGVHVKGWEGVERYTNFLHEHGAPVPEVRAYPGHMLDETLVELAAHLSRFPAATAEQLADFKQRAGDAVADALLGALTVAPVDGDTPEGNGEDPPPAPAVN